MPKRETSGLAVRCHAHARRRRRAGLAAATLLAAIATVSFAASPAQAADGTNRLSPSPEMKGADPDQRRATPPLREDEPEDGGRRAPDESEEVRPPPYSGGCPYRGKTLELIV